MKKQWILIVALMIGTNIFAQQKDAGKHRDGRSEKMKSELSLNDAQYEGITAINEKYHTKHTALKADSTQSREQRSAKMKLLRGAQNKEIDSILTPEQKTKWEAYKSAQRQTGNQRTHKAGQNYENRLKAELSLTDDQFVKLQATNKAFREQLHLLKDNTDARVDRNAEMGRIKGELEKSVKAILSPEQYQKWVAHREEMRRTHQKHKRRG
ncbi:MAG: hypothetical protein WKF87_12195 [Chryseolinea sp.]